MAFSNLSVHPAHLAFVLLNEGQAPESVLPGSRASSRPLFASVIQRAGGDPVSNLSAVQFLCTDSLALDTYHPRSTKTHRQTSLSVTSPRRNHA